MSTKRSLASSIPAIKVYGLPIRIQLIGPTSVVAAITDLDSFQVPATWDVSKNGYGVVLTDAILSVSNNAHTGGSAGFAFQLIKNDDATNGILQTFTLATAFGRTAGANRRAVYDLRDSSGKGIPLLPLETLRLDCSAIPTGGTLNAGLANVRLHLTGLMFGLPGAG